MSDKSEACPMCGLDVGDDIATVPEARNDAISEDVQETQEPETHKPNKKRLTLIIAVSLSLIVLAGIVLGIYACKQNDIEEEPVSYETVESGSILFPNAGLETNNPESTQPEATESDQEVGQEMEPHKAASTSVGYVFVEETWLRSSARTGNGNLLTYEKYGSLIDIIENEGQWTKVKRFDGSLAYIASEDIITEEEFLRFNSIFSSDHDRNTLGELKYRKALLCLVTQFKVNAFKGIAFEKRFNDTGNSIAIFNVLRTDTRAQYFVTFDKSNNIVQLPYALASKSPYSSGVTVDESIKYGEYNTIKDVVEMIRRNNVTINGEAQADSSINYQVIGQMRNTL